jgi:hypothetical protein
LSVNHVQFDDSCLDAEVRIPAAYKVTTKDSCTKIERDGSLIGTVNQCRFRLLEAECQARGIATEYLCDSIPTWIAHVEKHELKRGFGSHQFWHGLRVALDSDGILGCCPLVAPSSFMYCSWDGITTDWGYQLQPSRPIYDLLRSTPEEQRFLSNWLRLDQVWFALTRWTTLTPSTKAALERNGRVITVYKRESLVAASKGSFRAGRLRAIQSKEDWVLWASAAALEAQREEGSSADSANGAVMRARADQVRLLKRRADSIRLTADGVVPLDVTCPSSREALLGPTGSAYTRSGVVVATDGSLKRNGSMGAALVAKNAAAARACTMAMARGQISKEYLAIVTGWPEEERWSVVVALSALLPMLSVDLLVSEAIVLAFDSFDPKT